MLKNPADDQIKVYRTKSQLVICTLAVVVIDALFVGKLVKGVDGPGVFTAVVAFCLIYTYIGLRVAFAAIVVMPTGVRVSNVFLRRFLSWDEIERFEIRRWNLLPYVCSILLRNGEVVHGLGIVESTRLPDGSGESKIDELNRELQRRRDETVGTVSGT